jgi:hypothetical protein
MAVNGEDSMKMKIIVMDDTEKRLGTFELEAGGIQEVEQALRCSGYRSDSCTASEAPEKQIFIRTFGHFDIFVNGHPIEFSSGKAKELLALLVDRGGGIVTTEEMLTYLWEERANDARSRNYCRKIVQRLHERLEQYGIGDIIIRHNRGRSLDTSKVMCDYYEYLEGKESRKTEFCGEYMTNYSWGEDRLIELLQLKDAEHSTQELRSGT